jgi:hypothetical protein
MPEYRNDKTNYKTLSKYNNNTASKFYIERENFGSFSISAAVRPPWNFCRGQSNCKRPVYPGVS